MNFRKKYFALFSLGNLRFIPEIHDQLSVYIFSKCIPRAFLFITPRWSYQTLGRHCMPASQIHHHNNYHPHHFHNHNRNQTRFKTSPPQTLPSSNTGAEGKHTWWPRKLYRGGGRGRVGGRGWVGGRERGGEVKWKGCERGVGRKGSWHLEEASTFSQHLKVLLTSKVYLFSLFPSNLQIFSLRCKISYFNIFPWQSCTKNMKSVQIPLLPTKFLLSPFNTGFLKKYQKYLLFLWKKKNLGSGHICSGWPFHFRL